MSNIDEIEEKKIRDAIVDTLRQINASPQLAAGALVNIACNVLDSILDADKLNAAGENLIEFTGEACEMALTVKPIKKD